MTLLIQDNAAINHSPVVRVVPLQPHCFAFGGFEMQMIGAMEAARSAGIDIEPLDSWSRQSDFDVIHCWGLDVQQMNAVRWARAMRKRVVLSALVGYPTWKASLRRRIRWSRSADAWRKRLLGMVDALTVVNQEQADIMCAIDGVSRERIFVVPNIVADVFLEGAISLREDHPADFTGYILTTGNICPRKNQLNLVRACRSLGVGLMLVGDVLTGEDAYGDVIATEIAGVENIRWVRELLPASPELVSAYRNARLFALPSHEETQPISALEAVAMGIPVLLSDRPYARQEYYARAGLVDPKSVESISAMLRCMLAQPGKFQTPRSAIEPCRASSVGSAYAALYRSLCD